MAHGFDRGAFRADLADGDGAAGVLSVLNPEGVDVWITRALLHVTHIATAAATIDIGVAATAISNDTIIDGLDVHSATGVFDNQISHGTDGLAGVKWAADGYLTATKASGACAGLAGELILAYTLL